MRRALLRDLHSALSNEEFWLAYQPIVNLGSDRVCSCEALLRWQHPQRGTLPPAEFIPILESSGLIVPVGEWVLQQACAEAASWPRNVRVAVNVSGVQFNSTGFIKTVANALRKSGLAADRLELELTETVLLEDSKNAIAALRELHALGVRLALDDFGTGYSTLSYLSNFPFDKIKIDRCFIQTVSKHDDSSRAIVSAVTRLGSTLGIETTAEGIETQEQLEIVRAKGCTSAQGFLLYRPMSATDIKLLLLTSPDVAVLRRCEGSAPSIDTEEDRLDALHQYDIMDTPPEESFDRITRIAQAIMHAPVAMISFVDRDRQWFKSRQGTDTCESPRDISFCAHTIQKDEPLVVLDALQDPRFRDSPLVTGPNGVRSYIGVPLRNAAGHRVGALCVNDVNPQNVTQEQLDRLQDLARLVVDELELRKLAAIDYLTGAATSRVFISQGKIAFNNARRQGRDLSCVVLDLDHFKSINDTYGHAAGDRVLMEVGTLCKSLIRSSDTFGRLGGEEFGILLPETPAEPASKVAEAIRKSIDLLIVHHLGHDIRPTASCGVASLAMQDRSFASILARADTALYEAKGGGRNKVVTEAATSGNVVTFGKRA